MDDSSAPAPAVNEAPVVEATTVTESAPVETNTSEPTVQESNTGETQVTEPVAEDSTDGSERQQPRPAQRRIQQLVEENKQLKELVGQAPAPQQPLQAPKLSQLLQGKESIDPAELDQLGEQYAAQVANGLVDLKVANLEAKIVQERAVSQLEADTQSLMKEPELDPESPLYNEKLDQAISNTWKRMAVQENPYQPGMRTLNPTVRLSDVAKDFLEAARASAEKQSANVQNSISELADGLSVSPGGSEPKVEKDFSQMSASEMEQVLRAKGYNV